MGTATPPKQGLALDSRAWFVMGAHVFFGFAAGILLGASYGDAGPLVLIFILLELITVTFSFVATLTPESVTKIETQTKKILPRLRVSGAPPENVRWMMLWLAILVGFYSSGVLVVNTGGPLESPFIQFPMTMIVLGALMTERGGTATFLAIFGLVYAALLVWGEDLFVAIEISKASDPKMVLYIATAINVVIGVTVSFLSRSEIAPSSPPSQASAAQPPPGSPQPTP